MPIVDTLKSHLTSALNKIDRFLHEAEANLSP